MMKVVCRILAKKVDCFNTPVILWLQALDIPLLMPAIKTRKQGEIKQFIKGRKSYKTNYTITRDEDDSVTFDLWIVCKYRKSKHKNHGIQYFVYVVENIKTNLEYIYQDYRKNLELKLAIDSKIFVELEPIIKILS